MNLESIGLHKGLTIIGCGVSGEWGGGFRKEKKVGILNI